MPFSFQPAAQIRCHAPVTAIAVGSDDRTAAAVCNNKLYRIDLRDNSQDELCTLSGSVSEIAIDTSHKLIAVAAGGADVAAYDLMTGDLVQTMSRKGAPGSLSTASANHIGLSPDGKMLVTTTSGSRIFVSNVDTGRWDHIMFVKYNGCDVAISPDGRHVALFGAAKASELSGHVTMFLVRRGLQPLWTRWHESDEAVTSASFSPDCESFVTCGAGDGVRVWDVQTGDLEWHRTSNDDGALRAAWSFGEKNVLATLGSKLKIVRKDQNDPEYRIAVQSSPSECALSPSGRLLLQVEDRSVLAAWKLSEQRQ